MSKLFGLNKKGNNTKSELARKEQAKKNVAAFRRNLELGKRKLEEEVIKAEATTNVVAVKEIKEVEPIAKETVKERKINKTEINDRNNIAEELARYNAEFKAIEDVKVLINVFDEIQRNMRVYRAVRKQDVTDVILLNIYRDVYNAYKLDEIGETLADSYKTRINRKIARMIREEVERIATSNKNMTEKDINDLAEELKNAAVKACKNK